METPRFGKKQKLVYAAAALFMGAGVANAAVELGSMGGFTFNTEGNVNAYVSHLGGDAPAKVGVATANTVGGTFNPGSQGVSSTNKISDTQVSSGAGPAGIAFNMTGPGKGDWEVGGRLSLWTGISGDNDKNDNSTIQWRQAYMTLSSESVGTFLAGRQVGLYQRHNLMSDYEQGAYGLAGGGGDFAGQGRFGAGYLFPNFHAQVSYTTPNMNGFELTVALANPSKISGLNGDADLAPATPVATITSTPRYEAEAVFAKDVNNGDMVKVFVSGLQQSAKFDATNQGRTNTGGNAIKTKTKAWGAAYGIGYDNDVFGAVLAGYNGKGLGTRLMLSEGNALDHNGRARKAQGWYGQAKAKATDCLQFAGGYGMSKNKKTTYDKTTGVQDIESVRTWNITAFYDITPSVKANAGFTKGRTRYMNTAQRQKNSTVSAGMQFSW